MKAKKRYLLMLASVAFLVLCHFGGHSFQRKHRRHAHQGQQRRQRHHRGEEELRWRSLRRNIDVDEASEFSPLKKTNLSLGSTIPPSTCRMETCFDFSLCLAPPFKHYVYPTATDVSEGNRISANYRKVLEVLRASPLYTDRPEEACLFVLAIDTLDRDPLSDNFVHSLQAKIDSLEHWNGGRNHIIFNMYYGTYPDYSEDELGFDIGHAILAKASASVDKYREGFDIALPLFHDTHPKSGGEKGGVRSSSVFPVGHSYFLSFKGKRYVYGIGSETRNSLHHLHNGADQVLLTTCKHGKSWKDLQDERCDQDNGEYDKWDYQVLVANSTFCLVPRGRRLGSFRFLETLQAGCVPVILSNGWRLPFAETVDWSRASVQADERLLLQTPEILHSVPPARILAMRQQTQVIWDKYLSSVEKIVDTTMEIVRERIELHRAREGLVWNSSPGALLTRPEYADALQHFPFRRDLQLGLGRAATHKFTAVIYYTQKASKISPPLVRLVQNASFCNSIDKIIVLWSSDAPVPARPAWPNTGKVPLLVLALSADERSPGARFRPRAEIETDAVLALNADSELIAEEMEFAFGVWNQFPERLVGFVARSHYWDAKRKAWAYTSRMLNHFSSVLTTSAFYHRYYHHLYSDWLPPVLHGAVEQAGGCEDILLNFLVAHVTRQPPVKVTQRKRARAAAVANGSEDAEHFSQSQSCFNSFAAIFGYVPLQKSTLRLDPILYKDAVSNTRKKYRKLEQLP